MYYNTVIQQGFIPMINRDIYNVMLKCIWNAFNFEHKNIKHQWFKRNSSWTPNLHIKMISEDLRDTVDRINGCWKFSFVITIII